MNENSSRRSFEWFYRAQSDHVISLCAGHAYLADRGGWVRGSTGNCQGLGEAHQCCVCNGFVTIQRMKDAPLIY